jgi:LPS sulfotransferase NodH
MQWRKVVGWLALTISCALASDFFFFCSRLLALKNGLARHSVASSGLHAGSHMVRLSSACERVFPLGGVPFATESTSAHKFVMFSRARSGSNWLVSLLGHHPSICMFYEAFALKQVYLNGKWKVTVGEREANRSAFLNSIYSAHQGGVCQNRTHIGFKVFDRQLSLEEFASLVESPHTKKIILVRRDILDQFVSLKKAMDFTAWTNKDTSSMTIDLNTRQFWKHAALSKDYGDCLASVQDASWMTVDYDTLKLSPRMELNRIFRHLGVDDAYEYEFKDNHSVQNKAKTCKNVENYEELACALRGTQYEDLLDVECLRPGWRCSQDATTTATTNARNSFHRRRGNATTNSTSFHRRRETR